jgi:pSer/pThr/pTyr-binding forkhead associated (FHA) protein
MAPLGYIEVLDAKGRVTARFAVDAWPVTIGRAYTNRVILDDPFVSPEHLSIGQDESDRLCANDLNSENGLRDAPGGKRVAVLPLVSGRPFQIGHTVLRYAELQQRVAATAVEGGERRPRVPSWILGLASLFIVLLVLLLGNYFESYERFNLARSLSETLTTLSMVFAWAGMWSLLSRVVIGRFHYAEHFALAGGAILVALLFSISAEWLEFLRPSLPALWVASVFGSGALLAALVFGHLGWASSMLRRSRLWAALGVSAVVIGAGAIADYAARNTFNTVMEYSGVIKAIDSRWLPAVSVDQFIADSQKVKRELEALVQKAKPAQP